MSITMYRRNLKYSRVKNLYKFASPKMNTVFTVESSLEFDTCFHLEYSSKIIKFEIRPLVINTNSKINSTLSP